MGSRASRRHLTHAGVGWAGLAVYVVAYDAWALRTRHESLSSCFGRSLAHPTRRPLVTAVWLLLSAHLFGGLLPPAVKKFDPIGFAARAIQPRSQP